MRWRGRNWSEFRQHLRGRILIREYRNVPSDWNVYPDSIVSAFASIVILQLLPKRVGLSPDNGIFSGRLVRASAEYFVGKKVFVDLGGIAGERQIADEPQELRLPLRAPERIAGKDRSDLAACVVGIYRPDGMLKARRLHRRPSVRSNGPGRNQCTPIRRGKQTKRQAGSSP